MEFKIGQMVKVISISKNVLKDWPEAANLIGQDGEVFELGRDVGVKFKVGSGPLNQSVYNDGKTWWLPYNSFEGHLAVKGWQNRPKEYVIRDDIKPTDIDPPEPKHATDFLSKALDLLSERGKEYDKPQGERSMGKCVAAFNAITGKDLRESEGWLLLQLLKDTRQWQNPDKYHADSAEDCISYAALKAEALAENK